jgi:uncharacterized protein (TIGR02145 family)
MKRHTCMVMLLAAVTSLQAQDYLIRFESSGASNTIDSIIVRNLTQETELVLAGNSALHLMGIPTNIDPVMGQYSDKVLIYPNPIGKSAILQYDTRNVALNQISIYDISGKVILQANHLCQAGRQKFQLKDIPGGMYFVKVNDAGKVYVGKVISTGEISDYPLLEYVSTETSSETAKAIKFADQDSFMQYHDGDQLLFTFYSGIFSTLVSDVPQESKTIAFNFYQCTDADHNNYPVVNIGEQVWMAENLRTTTLNDHTSIEYGFQDTKPVYCWYNNNEVENKIKYGGLYNWYTVATEELCPTDWHVPTKDEWNILISYLGGEQTAGGKLKETGSKYWNSPNIGATNSSNFGAVGVGMHYSNYGGPRIEFNNHEYCSWWTNSYFQRNTWRYGLASNSTEVSKQFVDFNDEASVRCLRDQSTSVPLLNTKAVINKAAFSAASGGEISSDGGSQIIARGICWATSTFPDTTDFMIVDTNSTFAFSCDITDLKPNTTYYVRSFAINKYGVGYGNLLVFKTKVYNYDNFSYGSVTDIDGNVYKTYQDGKKAWMAENLRTTKYNDGTPIPNIVSDTSWANLNSGAYCWFMNDTTYKYSYGGSYNYYAIETNRICPTGWHVRGSSDKNTIIKISEQDRIENPDLVSRLYEFKAGRNSNGEFTAGGWWSQTMDDPKYVWSYVYYLHEYWRAYTYSAGKKSGFSIRCVSDTINAVPYISTKPVINITGSSASSGGKVISMDDSEIFRAGICWDSSANPDTSDYVILAAHGINDFVSNIKNLSAGTTYYLKAFIIGKTGINYGNQVTFKTLAAITSASDVEGNLYEIVKIGNQTWMAENLKTTKYNDGSPIVHDSLSQSCCIGNDYDWYNNDINNKNIYGALYNLRAVGSDKLCPSGWHVPADLEWKELSDYLGGDNVAGSKLKETGGAEWYSFCIYCESGDCKMCTPTPTNESGFSALPSGAYSKDNGFFGINDSTSFWSSSFIGDTSAWGRNLKYNTSAIIRTVFYTDRKNSVRCINDIKNYNPDLPELFSDQVQHVSYDPVRITNTSHAVEAPKPLNP